ncbi:MAG: PA14 domain-containing protein, partial [Planctomycetota bacterium]|nr:PA14 domain-containing protein [Planctomycetota bacterium]
SPQLVFPATAPADSCWAYAGKTLYWLRYAGAGRSSGSPRNPEECATARPEVLWQTYVGLDNAWVTVGPAAIAVGNARKVVFVDRATGEVLWSVTLAGLQNNTHAGVNLDPFYAATMDENLAAVTARDALLCFDLRTGKERWWNKQYERRVLHCAFVDGRLAEVSGHGGQPTVYNAYDPRTGAVLESRALNRLTDWTWSAASPDGRVMAFRSNSQTVLGVDMATGRNAWEAKVAPLDFRWDHRNLSWERGAFIYSGASRNRPDRGWVVFEISPKDGSIRLLKAFVSSTNDRLYLLFTRETASLYFVLRTFDWANGQLLDEEILPGAPFQYESWDKPYRGLAEAAGDLLLYTASDGIYACTPRGATRRQSAAALRAALANPALDAAARCDLRCSLAGMEPVVLHALLASADTRVDGELGEWDQSAPLELAGAECFTPLQDGAAWAGPEDLSARIHAAWNTSAVFIAVDVRDDQWVPPASVASLTSGDSLRVAVNAAPDHRYGYDPKETVVCALALVNGQTVLNLESGPPDDPQMRPVGCVTRAPDGHGLRYELALPWPLLRHDPALRPGDRRELRVGVAVYDNDGKGTKGALEWGAGLTVPGDAAGQDVSHAVFPPWLGQLSLLDISRARIARYKKAIAWISDTPEAMQYLRMILASKRGPQAARERAAELTEFVTAHPASANALRALIFLRSAYLEMGEADATGKAAAVARAAKCPAAVVEALLGKTNLDEKGAGLEGEYYGSPDFINLKLTRIDPAVNFDWTGKSPHPSIGSESYSVRWAGQVKPAHSEVYTFYTWSDDGVRLWVDNKLVVDNWTDHPATENSGTITLGAGIKYDVRLEYFQGWGAAVIALAWSSPSLPREIIPQTCLYPPDFLGTTAKRTPADWQKLQDGYRAAARLLPDSPDGWVLLQRALEGYAPGNTAQRSRECEQYLKEFPETANALQLLLALRQLYTQAGRNALSDVEEQMQICKLPREVRRAFYAQCIPAWSAWHVLGPVQAQGENRGMEQVLEPERAVDLGWKGAGPLEVPLAWTRIARTKDDPDNGGCVDLYRYLAEKLAPEKKAEIERAPYFAYAYRKVTVPTARRALLFFGVNDTVAVWLNGKRVVAPCSPGAGKDSRAVEVLLKEGDNEILLKAGVPNSRLYFFFRIADSSGRPFDDLPRE